MSDQNRRKYNRAPLRVEIYCSDLPKGANRGLGVVCFYSTNISVGGLFLETDVSFQEGHIIHLQFKLPGSGRIMRLQGKVVRNAEAPPSSVPGMAIEFLQMGFEEREAIEGFVRGTAVPDEQEKDVS